MKKLLTLLTVVLAFTAACASDDELTATAPAADGAEGPAEPDPLRIVSLSATATESIFAMGAEDLLVAVDNFSNHPANELPTIDAFSPSVEAITEFEPDLVIVNFDPGDLVSGLETLGIDTLTQGAAFTIADAYSQIEELGAATDHADEAADVVVGIQTALADLVANAPDGTGISYYHELDNTLFTVTSSTFIGEIYGLFGLENAADPADEDGAAFGYPQLNEEYLLDADPDLVFLADTICCGQDAATVAERPGWSGMSAVQNGNVIELNDDIASRWGPRIVEFAEAIAEALAAAG